MSSFLLKLCIPESEDDTKDRKGTSMATSSATDLLTNIWRECLLFHCGSKSCLCLNSQSNSSCLKKGDTLLLLSPSRSPLSLPLCRLTWKGQTEGRMRSLRSSKKLWWDNGGWRGAGGAVKMRTEEKAREKAVEEIGRDNWIKSKGGKVKDSSNISPWKTVILFLLLGKDFWNTFKKYFQCPKSLEWEGRFE